MKELGIPICKNNSVSKIWHCFFSGITRSETKTTTSYDVLQQVLYFFSSYISRGGTDTRDDNLRQLDLIK